MTGELERRADWVGLAQPAWILAQQVARTEFIPKDLRGKPEAVLAAILYGHELGLGPFQAVQNMHVIDGRVDTSAELARALVFRAGHEMRVDHADNRRAVVWGRRGDNRLEDTVTWTLDMAEAAGLLRKDNWRRYPRPMLVARATSELVSRLFPDVMLGMPGLADAPDDVAGAPPRTEEDAEGEAIGDEAPVQRTVTHLAPATPPPTPEPVPEREPPTPAQRRMLFAMLGQAGLSDDERRAWASQQLDRPVLSFVELSRDDVSHLIDAARDTLRPATVGDEDETDGD